VKFIAGSLNVTNCVEAGVGFIANAFDARKTSDVPRMDIN
jgi:hypothetical protein